MKLTHSMFQLLGIAVLCLATTGIAESRNDRDKETQLQSRNTCPTTREEIAALKACVQCPSKDNENYRKVCCPPNDRFDGARGGCVITPIEDACRNVEPEAARKRCYEDSLQGSTIPALPVIPGGPGATQLPSGSAPPIPDPSFDTCMNTCQQVQRYTPFLDIIGCRYACGPNSINPPDNNFQTGGCLGLRRYCYSLRFPPSIKACLNLHQELCY